MAPPSGTLRVGRYFLALIALIAVLYLVVFFPGNRHTPKLGIDLAGGTRVEFKAQVPKGLPQPTSGQMDEARQIIEDRINSKGVSGATVVVQDPNELIVEIPSATKADIAQLGEAAILNFRGLLAPIVPVTCTSATTPSTSSSATPSGSSTGSSGSTPTPTTSGTSTGTSPAASSPAANTPSDTSSKAPADARDRPLQAPATTSSTKTPTKSAATPTKSAATPTKSAATPTTASSATTTPSTTGTAAPSGSGTAAPSTAAAAPAKCTSTPFAAVVKTYPTLKTLLEPTVNQVGLNAEECPSPAMPQGPKNAAGKTTTAPCHAFSSLTAAQQSAVEAALTNYDCSAAQTEPDLQYNAYIACDKTGQEAYLLGHVVVPGADIDSATSVAPSAGGQTVTSQYSVNLTLTNAGGNKWSAWTSKYNTGGQTATSPVFDGSATAACGPSATYPCSTFVGFTLDGQVISAPFTQTTLDTQTNISGDFPTQGSADSLAQQLNYGKLSVSFSLQQSETVSATLGTTQLNAAFLAGGIGLLLVVLYSLLYYRGLGLVTIASLVMSAILTYAMLVILGAQIGFTLDLSGIAGFIVALGITADSFVVFFERIKDEVHEGRSIRVAVPRAWVRARRTVLSADTVSFLAAAILYFFASADVKGFAFTLGMSTILDLVVVFLFTHPIVSLLSRSSTFGSPRFTGLNAVRGTPIPDDPPAAGAGKPARTRPARAGKGSSKPAATAVADPEVDDPTVDDATTESDVDPSDTPTRPRTTGPASGTAAERAAARRARMREQSGDTDPEGGQ